MTGASADNSCERPTPKVGLFGFRFDSYTLGQAVDRVFGLLELEDAGHYVVTPNVDHAVLLHKRPELLPVYSNAALVIADGLPLIWASKWLKKGLPERVAGSDLVPAIFRAAQKPLRVYLLGAGPGIAQTAADNIASKYPNVRIAGVQSPPIGFEREAATNDSAVALVAATAPDILVLGLGAPKQELWAYRERHRLNAKVILCAGATIDFLAGARRRAPLWCQRYGLEWAYRALTEPRRLVPRYAEDAIMLPWLIAKEMVQQSSR